MNYRYVVSADHGVGDGDVDAPEFPNRKKRFCHGRVIFEALFALRVSVDHQLFIYEGTERYVLRSCRTCEIVQSRDLVEAQGRVWEAPLYRICWLIQLSFVSKEKRMQKFEWMKFVSWLEQWNKNSWIKASAAGPETRSPGVKCLIHTATHFFGLEIAFIYYNS